MSETDKKVRFKYKKIHPLKKIAYCPDCDVQLKHCGTGISTGWNTDVMHSCNSCKKEYWLDDFYPTMVYEEDISLISIAYEDIGYAIKEEKDDKP